MKRVGLAVLTAAIIFGAVFGLAASLGLSSNTLGAGFSSVVACQSGTVTASYATSYDSTIPGYKVGVVTLDGLDTASAGVNCASKSFKVTLTGPGASNASLAEVTGTTPASGTSFTANFTSSNIAASSVTGIHVVLSG